jgi:hypothetical protein
MGKSDDAVRPERRRRDRALDGAAAGAACEPIARAGRAGVLRRTPYADLPGAAPGRPGLHLAVDWPAPALWSECHTRGGPPAATAARAARLNAYALARLAGWPEQAPRFRHGAALALTFLPAHPRHWDAAGALAACAPLLWAIGDALNVPPGAISVASIAVDFAPRLAIVIVHAMPCKVPPRGGVPHETIPEGST